MSNYIKIAEELTSQLAELEKLMNTSIISCARQIYEMADKKPYYRDTSPMQFENRSYRSFLDSFRVINAVEITSWSITFISYSERLFFRFNELHLYQVTDKLAILDVLEQLLKNNNHEPAIK